MSRLLSYIASGVLRGVAVVLLVIVAIGVMIEFVGQLDDVGLAQYGLPEAIAYVALRLPRLTFEVLPAAALLGALLSLGNLAIHRELVVMRASGVSALQIMGAVAVAGVGLMVVMLLLGESFAPSLSAYARELRAQALLDDVAVANGQSAWLKDDDRIINLRRPSEGIEFDGGVSLFVLDGDTALRQMARASSAGVELSNEWLLFDYAETTFSEDGTSARREASVRQNYNLSPDLLGLSVVQADSLNMPALIRYIAYLRSNNLDAAPYLAAYWGRIANIVSVLFMAMLAVPFVFGSLRAAGAGARLVVGLVIGLAYYVVVQLSASIGEVFSIDPVLAAWAPSAMLVFITFVALLRVR